VLLIAILSQNQQETQTHVERLLLLLRSRKREESERGESGSEFGAREGGAIARIRNFITIFIDFSYSYLY